MRAAGNISRSNAISLTSRVSRGRIISLCGPDGVYRGAHIAVTLACSGKGGT